MADDIKVIGIKEVTDLFKSIQEISIRSVTKAAKAGAQISLNAAVGNCPVSVDGSHGKAPGTLKKSLRLKIEKKRSEGKRVYTVGPDQDGWYAHFVDYGYTDKNGKYHQGNKFLRDSVDKNRNQIDQAILKTLSDELQKVR